MGSKPGASRINWKSDDLMKVAKMLAWVIYSHLEIRKPDLHSAAFRTWLPVVTKDVLGSPTTFKEFERHVMKTQNKRLNSNILLQRGHKTMLYDEHNEFANDVLFSVKAHRAQKESSRESSRSLGSLSEFESLTDIANRESRTFGGRGAAVDPDGVFLAVSKGRGGKQEFRITLGANAVKRARFQSNDRIDLKVSTCGLMMVERRKDGRYSLTARSKKLEKSAVEGRSIPLSTSGTVYRGFPYYGMGGMPSTRCEYIVTDEGVILELPRHPKAEPGDRGW